jgi:MFS family permease
MPAARTADAIHIVALLCLTYMLSQFYRSANAVIGPDLMRDLSLQADDLGLLTGAFFIVFAACQIPAGLLLDRYGPRRVMSATMAFGVAGAVVFALGDDLAQLTAGRILLGIGSCALLMGPLVVFSRWFAPSRFATVSSVLLGVGTAGSLGATAPLALAAESIGWRGAFLVMAALTALLAALVYLFVRDAPPGHALERHAGESLGDSLRGLAEVFRNPRLPRVFAMNLTAYGVLITVLGLWGGPYLNDVHGLDGPGRGNVLLVMAAANVVGYFVVGPLDRLFDTRKRLVQIGSAVTILLLLVLALAPALTLWQVTVLFGLLGLAGGHMVMVVAHGRAIFPDRLVGRGMTTLNIGTMGGAALMQIVTGYAVEAMTPAGAAAPESAYRLAFGILAAILIVALAVYSPIDDARPSQAAR